MTVAAQQTATYVALWTVKLTTANKKNQVNKSKDVFLRVDQVIFLSSKTNEFCRKL